MTPRQRYFAKRYAESGDPYWAADKAGYANPDSRVTDLKRNENVMAVVQRHREMISLDILPVAVRRHQEALEDPNTGGTTLKGMIELGYRYGFAALENLMSKDAAEMTPEELEMATRMASKFFITRAGQSIIPGAIAQYVPSQPSQAYDIFD